ncbi:MAG TPA: nucleotidyltransferase family protein [Polyangia bacterium]|jgi:hypothetical protein|nr:nucleotidyltransferase family protein [Polyangia bacterium]
MGPLAADWLLALPEAVRRRGELLPLLHAVLEREGRLDALPPAERTAARHAYVATLARSREIGAALLASLEDAAALGVPVLPLKGALLAFTVYPDPGMRPMLDLDLAIRPDDVERLGARLLARGYQRHGAGRRRFDLSYTHHAVYVHERAPTIELHTRLTHELGIDGQIGDWFGRAISVEAPALGRPLPAPAWDDQLFFVLAHAATHSFGDSPLWLIDVACLASRASAQGSAEHPVAAEARRRHAVAAVYFALGIARRRLPPSLPLPDVPEPTALAARTALLRLAVGDEPLAHPPTRPGSLLARAALTDSATDVVRALAAKSTLRLKERLLERKRDT